MEKRNLFKDKYFITLILFMSLISGVLFFDFILNKRLYIFYDIGGDTRQSYWPMYKYIIDAIREGTLRNWSFQIGLGTSTFTLYSFLFDPFIILLFLFPVKHLAYGILVSSIVKIFISGVLFYCYLQLHSIKRYPSVITSLIWAFNGYMMLWGQHYWFASMMVIFTFIMLSLEFWLRGKRTYLFPISIAIMAINSPYFLFMISLFIFFYVIFHYTFTEKTFALKQLFLRLVRFFGAYFNGLGAGAVVFLPVSYLILSSPRTSGAFFDGKFFYLATFNEYISIFLRTFSNNALGVGMDYFGSLNYYEGPMLSSSLLFILALPQLFFTNAKLKHKIGYLLAIALCLLLLIFPFFSTLFSAFSSFNYRWNFLIVFLNVLTIGYMLHRFSQERRLSYIGLSISALIVIFGWYFSYKIMTFHNMIPIVLFKEHYLQGIAKWVGIFLALYTITFLVFKNNKLIWFMLLCLVTAELIIFNYPTVNKRLTVPVDVQAKKEGYYDFTIEAVKYIKLKDKEFYRIDKNYDSYSYNDSLFQNYSGVKSYNSLNHPSYVKFFKELDTGASNYNLGGGFNQRSYLRDLTGVKYILSKDEDIPSEYTELKTFGDVHVYQNPYVLPIGITYDSYMTEAEFAKLMPFGKDAALINTVVMDHAEGLPKYINKRNQSERTINMKLFTVNNGELKNIINNHDFNIVTNSTDPWISMRLPKNADGWRIELEIIGPRKTNGQIFWARNNTSFNQGDSYTFDVSETPEKVAYELNIKNLEELRIDPGATAGTYTIKNLSITPIDHHNQSDLTQALTRNNLQIEEFSNDYIKGKVSADRKSLLFLSIPYDKGWTIKIDGKESKTERVNIGFTGTVLTKGNHTIELTYHQPLLRVGGILSFLCWGIIIWRMIPFRKRKKNIPIISS